MQHDYATPFQCESVGLNFCIPCQRSTDDKRWSTHTHNLKTFSALSERGGALTQYVKEGNGHADILTDIRLNLARALARSQQHDRAVHLYSQLQDQGVCSSAPCLLNLTQNMYGSVSANIF